MPRLECLLIISRHQKIRSHCTTTHRRRYDINPRRRSVEIHLQRRSQWVANVLF